MAPWRRQASFRACARIFLVAFVVTQAAEADLEREVVELDDGSAMSHIHAQVEQQMASELGAAPAKKTDEASETKKGSGSPTDNRMPSPNKIAAGGVSKARQKDINVYLKDLIIKKYGAIPRPSTKKAAKLATRPGTGSARGSSNRSDMVREALIRQETKKVSAEMKAKVEPTWDKEIKSKAALKARAALWKKAKAWKSIIKSDLMKRLNLSKKLRTEKMARLFKEKNIVRGTRQATMEELKLKSQFDAMKTTPAVLEKANLALYHAVVKQIYPGKLQSFIPLVTEKEERELQAAIKAKVRLVVDKKIEEAKKAQRAKEAAKEVGRKTAKKNKAELEKGGKPKDEQVLAKQKEIYAIVAKSQSKKALAQRMHEALQQLAQAKLLMKKGDMEGAGKAGAAQVKLDADIDLAAASLPKSAGDEIRRLKTQISAILKPPTGGTIKKLANGMDLPSKPKPKA